VPRYVAFLRGVSPMNARMPDLKRAFESAGFTDVKTVLSSGNVAFTANARSQAALARRAEDATARHMSRPFHTIVRASSALRELIDADPFAAFDLPANAKRIVTFLPDGHDPAPALPVEAEGVHLLASTGHEILIAYVPHPRGPVFMSMIERTFGTRVTTRTWETVKKCAAA